MKVCTPYWCVFFIYYKMMQIFIYFRINYVKIKEEEENRIQQRVSLFVHMELWMFMKFFLSTVTCQHVEIFFLFAKEMFIVLSYFYAARLQNVDSM